MQSIYEQASFNPKYNDLLFAQVKIWNIFFFQAKQIDVQAADDTNFSDVTKMFMSASNI